MNSYGWMERNEYFNFDLKGFYLKGIRKVNETLHPVITSSQHRHSIVVCLGKRCLSRLDSSCTLQTGGMLPGRQTAAPRVASSAPWVGKPSRRGRGSGARRHRRLCYEGGMALEREGGYTRALPPIDVHSRSPLAPTPGDSGPSAIPRRGGATAGTSHPEGGRDDDDAPARPPKFHPRGLRRFALARPLPLSPSFSLSSRASGVGARPPT